MSKKLKIIVLIIIIAIIGILLVYGIIKSTQSDDEHIDNNIEVEDKLYADLETIPLDYNFSQIVEDGCYIITNTGIVYNLKNLENFVNNVQNNVKDQIRIVQYTTEGQPVITDLEYTKDKFILKHDSRRDGFSAEEDRIIRTTEYDASNYELQKGDEIRIVNENVSLRETYLIEKDTHDSIYICPLAEIKQTDNAGFELEFKKNDKGKVKILDASETDKYDYDIYSYKGEVNIIIDAEKMSLRDALLNNKITVEQILEKAEKDSSENIILRLGIADGGSRYYIYDNYSILKCNRIISSIDDRNTNLYIGVPSMYIGDVTE